MITRMNDVRDGEQRDVETWLAANGFDVAHPPPEARIEGGDVLHLDDMTLVGRSARTNDAGIAALRIFMRPFRHDVKEVPVPRCLHLKSAMTCLGEQTILISRALIDVELPAGYQRIDVDPSEPEAGNVLRINDCLMQAAGFPATSRILQRFASRHSLQLIQLDISEARKGDGALTCQSILW
jgi:dimethylargininase